MKGKHKWTSYPLQIKSSYFPIVGTIKLIKTSEKPCLTPLDSVCNVDFMYEFCHFGHFINKHSKKTKDKMEVGPGPLLSNISELNLFSPFEVILSF